MYLSLIKQPDKQIHTQPEQIDEQKNRQRDYLSDKFDIHQ